MKKLITTLCLSALATAGFAQGLINGGNGGTTLFRTNSVATGGAAGTATIAGTGGNFYYALFVNASTVTTVDSSLQGLAAAGWSDTSYRGTNSALAGRVASGQTSANNWAFNTYESFFVVGWTKAEGDDWATVSAKLIGATFDGTKWTGPLLTPGGFIGRSTIQAGQPGGGSPALPVFLLFGSSGSGQGTPITTPTDMFIVAAVPEPSTFALIGLGSAALLIFRRRK